MDELRKRVDPTTGFIRPNWRELVGMLGVSRSTLARRLAKFHKSGDIESVVVLESQGLASTRYRLIEFDPPK